MQFVLAIPAAIAGLWGAKKVQEHLESTGTNCIDYLPAKNQTRHALRPNAIFVSVASYRDAECSKTIKSMYETAKWPDRVFVGICQQNKEGEKSEDCLSCFRRRKQMRVIEIPHSDAKGPAWARYHCSTLWRGEEYFLQIDSHTTFVENWDETLITMLNQASRQAPKPVLTAYPPTEAQMKTKGTPVMANGRFGGDDIPMFLAKWDPAERDAPKKAPSPFLAAGFFFARGEFLYDVPFDPFLAYVFMGEEVLLSARLFTHGYDMFTPNKKVCYHYYGRKGEPKVWNDSKKYNKCTKKGLARVKYLLGRTSAPGDAYAQHASIYGMGKVRSLGQFWKEGGIDWENKTVEDKDV